MYYKVVGVDRVSEEPREEFYEVADMQDAIKRAADDGIAIVDVELVEEVRRGSSEGGAGRTQTDPVDDMAGYSQQSLAQRPGVRDQLNQSGVIAVGVFFGLLAFSCISPFVFMIVMAIIVAMGQQPAG